MFAHQGGWDEILLVLVPIAVIAALLALARRRAGEGVIETGGTDSEGETSARAAGDVGPEDP